MGRRSRVKLPLAIGLVALITSLSLVIVVIAKLDPGPTPISRGAASAAPGPGNSLLLADKPPPHVRQRLYLSEVSAAEIAWRRSNIPLMEELLTSQIPGPGESDHRDFEWYVLWKFLQRSRPAQRFELPDQLKAVAFSPEGEFLAVVLGSDHSVALLDPTTGEIRQQFESVGSHRWRREFVAISPDGDTLAYQGDSESIIRLRDLSTEEVRDIRSPDGDIYCAEFSPQGDGLVTGSSTGTIRLWDLENGTSTVLDQRKAPVSSLAYSPDAALLAVSCVDSLPLGQRATDGVAHKQVNVYDLDSGKIHCEVHHDTAVGAVAFSPDGRWLASGSSGVLKVYDFNDDSEVTVWRDDIDETAIDSPGAIRSLAFSPNGKWLASAGFGMRIWDISDYSLYATLGGHLNAIQEVTFSPNDLLASVSLDHTLMTWDLSSTHQINGAVRKFGGRVYNIAICPNGEVAVQNNWSTRLAMWDPVSDRVRYVDEVGRMALAESGILAITASGKIRFLDLATGEEAESPIRVSVNKMAYSSSDLLALGGNDGTFELWKVSTGELVMRSGTGLNHVSNLVFSPDGKFAACAHPITCCVSLWNIEERKQERVLDVGIGCGELSLDFSPDSRSLAVGRQFLGVQIWDISDEEQLPTVLPVATTAVKFAPSGKSLYSGSLSDNYLHVWDLATHRRKCTLPGVARMMDIAISADGKTVAVGGWKGTVRLLRGASEEEVRGL